MKKIVILILTLNISVAFAQVNGGRNVHNFAAPFVNNQTGNVAHVPEVIVSAWTRVDYAEFIKKQEINIEGSPYAFEEWQNNAELIVGDKKYSLNNINFNMRTNTIESRVSNDSIYIFDLANTDHAFINNRKFKSFYIAKKGKDEIFELIYEGKDFKLLRGYEVRIKRPRVDPTMVRKSIAKYMVVKRFYIKDADKIYEISLKNKNLAPLFNDKANLVKEYMKKHNLSYKKDRDLKRIFNYYSSL